MNKKYLLLISVVIIVSIFVACSNTTENVIEIDTTVSTSQVKPQTSDDLLIEDERTSKSTSTKKTKSITSQQNDDNDVEFETQVTSTITKQSTTKTITVMSNTTTIAAVTTTTTDTTTQKPSEPATDSNGWVTKWY